MKLAGADAETDEAQTETVNPDAELVIDPHLVQMLAAAGKGRVQTDAETENTGTDDETDDAGLLALAGLDASVEAEESALITADKAGEQEEDKAADAGFLSVASLPDETRQTGQQPVPQTSPLAAIAEDMKQDTAQTKGGHSRPSHLICLIRTLTLSARLPRVPAQTNCGIHCTDNQKP